MDVRTADLQRLPLFRGIDDGQLQTLLGVFHKESVPAGKTLFEAGDVATHLRILLSGTVKLVEDGAAPMLLRPMTLIGELGSLTATPRNATATTESSCEFLAVEGSRLVSFFDATPELALAFHKNLLAAVAEKLRRDKQRTDQMRANLIKTQKAMKELREFVFASPETAISAKISAVLDEHIQRNRRAGYRVSPTAAYPAKLRFADGEAVDVLELSNGFVKVATTDFSDPANVAAALILPDAEILVSGSVERKEGGASVLKLDAIIEEYLPLLEGYVTQLQLLDYVV
jgi:CRP-like cAMP-binding protein